MKVLCFSVLLLLTGSFTLMNARDKQTDPAPKLIIGITIDHMQYQYLERYSDHFKENGFKRLMEQGDYWKEVQCKSYISGSATGHASIGTGSYPSAHGIISTKWYARSNDEMKHCTRDKNMETLGGSYGAGKYSPHQLLTPTFSDYIQYDNINGTSKVIGISLNNTGSILPAGFSADAAYWFDPKFGKWITNSYYKDSLPRWVKTFNKKDLPDILLEDQWEPLYPIGQYQQSLNDHNPYEKGWNNQNTFPYPLKKMQRKKKGYKLLKQVPMGHTFTKDFALYAIKNEKLGQDSAVDVLMLNFPIIKTIEKRFGPRSKEMQDTWTRLDKDMAHFLNYIDKHIGKENVLLYVTSPHAPHTYMPYLKDTKLPSGYLKVNKVWILLETYLNGLYGKEEWLSKYHNQMLYLNHSLIEKKEVDLFKMQNKIASFLTEFDAVSEAYPAHYLRYQNYTRGIPLEVQNSYHNERSGDIIFTLESGIQVKQLENFSRHTPQTTVPLIFYGTPELSKKQDLKPEITDICPTILQLLDIPSKGAIQGTSLY